MRGALLLPFLLMAGMGVGAVPPAPTAAGEQALARELARYVPDGTVDCVEPQDVRSTRIIAGTAVIYDEVGWLYVNRPNGADTLRDGDALATRVDGGQLCRLDTVTLLDPVTRMTRGFVVLNAFQRYRRARGHP